MTNEQEDFLLDPYVRDTLRRWVNGPRPCAADAGVLNEARRLGFLDLAMLPTAALTQLMLVWMK